MLLKLVQRGAAFAANLRCSSVNISQVELAKRYSSYRSHRDWDPEQKVSYEVSKDPEEWKMVERLLPQKYIPDPQPRDKYVSGWWPQTIDVSESPYFVRRSKNHMTPVYLKIKRRGMQRWTVVRHIRGDIWIMEQELKKYLLDKTRQRSMGVKIDEIAGKITFRGDYVHHVTQWFKEKGL